MGKSCFDGYLTPECATCEDWKDGTGESSAIGCGCRFPIMECKAFAKMYNEEHKEQYRTVYDLTPEELDELRAAYYEQLEETDDEVMDGVESYEEVTDEMLFNHYDGVSFVRDDFFCNMAEETEA